MNSNDPNTFVGSNQVPNPNDVQQPLVEENQQDQALVTPPNETSEAQTQEVNESSSPNKRGLTSEA